MIGKLTGILDSTGEDYIIIDVQGVGYQVYCSSRTLVGLPDKGEAVSMVIETYVRENEIRLFGFVSDLERQWFCLLQSVQGIGAKVALAVQSTLSVAELASAITLQDKVALVRVPGIGQKVGQRIVTELKDKIPAVLNPADSVVTSAVKGEALLPAINDAISVLGNLGYSSQQATGVISSVARSVDGEIDSTELVRLGLKRLAKQ